jgi:hypothetical protein
VGEGFPNGNLKSIHVLRARVREGPGDHYHSPRSGEGLHHKWNTLKYPPNTSKPSSLHLNVHVQDYL